MVYGIIFSISCWIGSLIMVANGEPDYGCYLLLCSFGGIAGIVYIESKSKE